MYLQHILHLGELLVILMEEQAGLLNQILEELGLIMDLLNTEEEVVVLEEMEQMLFLE